MNNIEYLLQNTRTIENWPTPGVRFRDITSLLINPKAFRVLIDIFVHRYMDQSIDLIAGLDARGFIVGSVLAYELNLGFVPIRKKGKLPGKTVEQSYELEYSSATIEMQVNAIKPGNRILIIDDLIATGGTMLAGAKLIEQLGGVVVEGASIINLSYLKGSQLLAENNINSFSILNFAD